jgi:NAD+ kinase
MAMTAVSAYSPRHWKGGLLKDNAKIKITNNNPSKRPIVAHADHIESKDVISVEIEMSEGLEIPLLFDNDHKIEERVYKEMFKSQ